MGNRDMAPGRVPTEDWAAAMKTGEAAGQILADTATRRCTTKGPGPRVDAWAGQLGFAGPVGIMQASEVPGAG